MAKNLVPEVCKLLGVEVGEGFKIKDVRSGYITNVNYLIDEDGRVNVLDDDDGGRICATLSLDKFLTGDYEIVKLPWKPKDGEKYWAFEVYCNESTTPCYTVGYSIWMGAMIDFARLKAGWVYRTREEAETALPMVAKELGVEYEL